MDSLLYKPHRLFTSRYIVQFNYVYLLILFMKNQNWLTILALRSSILLSIGLLLAEVSYAASMGKPLSYLMAVSSSPAASLTPTPLSSPPTQTSLHSLTDDAINENKKFNFELLHDAAKRNYDRYMNVVWGSFSFLLIAIGWIITSEKARIFLHEKEVIRNVALRAIGIIFLFHVISIGNAAFKSHDLLQLIKKDPYVLSSSLSRLF